MISMLRKVTGLDSWSGYARQTKKVLAFVEEYQSITVYDCLQTKRLINSHYLGIKLRNFADTAGSFLKNISLMNVTVSHLQ